MARKKKETNKIDKPTKVEKTVEEQEIIIETQSEDTMINSTEAVIENPTTDINEQSAPINEEEKPSTTETPINPRHAKFSFGVSDGWYN